MLEEDSTTIKTTNGKAQKMGGKPKEKLIEAGSYEEYRSLIEEYERQTNTKYIMLRCTAGLKGKFTPRTAHRIFWDDSGPFMIAGTAMHGCHLGRDNNVYQKRKYAEKRDSKEKTAGVMTKRLKTKGSKKLGCPAVFHVRHVFRFTDFVIKGKTKSQREKVSTAIRAKITSGELVNGRDVFIFGLPDVSEHKNHEIGVSLKKSGQKLDKRVEAKIEELALDGKRDIYVVSKLVLDFVESELKQTPKYASRFRPTYSVISSIINRVKKEERQRKIDHENLEKVTQQMSDCYLYFRTSDRDTDHIASNMCDARVEDCVENHDYTLHWKSTPTEHLLFVYQSSEMRRLFNLYAHNTVLLDAAYRTSKYAVPIYFVVVQTNVNYQVVAVIITECETVESLVESLKIIKEWNPAVTPKYGMVPKISDEASKALRSVYADIRIFICPFHRDQQWMRWISKYKSNEVDVFMEKFRRIASARDQATLDKAVSDLKSWDRCSSSDVKLYFEKNWLPTIDKWALANRPIDLLFEIGDDVERRYEELKYLYLQGCSHLPLSEMVETLTRNFCRTKYAYYVRHNLIMMDSHKDHVQNIPEFLRNRPNWLVEHIMPRMAAAKLENCSRISVMNEKFFVVPSSIIADRAQVVRLSPSERLYSCSCDEYGNTRLVCKHLFQVGIQSPQYQLENLASWLLVDPIYKCDKEVISESMQNIVDEEKVSYIEEHVRAEQGLVAVENEQANNFGDSQRKLLLMKCSTTMRLIQSLMFSLPPGALKDLDTSLTELHNQVSSAATKESDAVLSAEEESTVVSTAPEPVERPLQIVCEPSKRMKHYDEAQGNVPISSEVRVKKVVLPPTPSSVFVEGNIETESYEMIIVPSELLFQDELTVAVSSIDAITMSAES